MQFETKNDKIATVNHRQSISCPSPQRTCTSPWPSRILPHDAGEQHRVTPAVQDTAARFTQHIDIFGVFQAHCDRHPEPAHSSGLWRRDHRLSQYSDSSILFPSFIRAASYFVGASFPIDVRFLIPWPRQREWGYPANCIPANFTRDFQKRQTIQRRNSDGLIYDVFPPKLISNLVNLKKLQIFFSPVFCHGLRVPQVSSWNLW